MIVNFLRLSPSSDMRALLPVSHHGGEMGYRQDPLRYPLSELGVTPDGEISWHCSELGSTRQVFRPSVAAQASTSSRPRRMLSRRSAQGGVGTSLTPGSSWCAASLLRRRQGCPTGSARM